MIHAVIRASLRNPVSVLISAIVVIVAGSIQITRLPIGYYPIITPPKLTVVTTWPGLPAREIMEALTVPIEDTMSSLKGLRDMHSSSSDDLSMVTLDFEWGLDMREVAEEVRDAAEAAELRLPQDSGKPLILPVNPNDKPAIILSVIPRPGVDIPDLRDLCDREIRSFLQKEQGVGAIQVIGGLPWEILVEPDPSRLGVAGLSISDIATSIRSSAVESQAGSITEGEIEYLVKTDGRLRNMSDLREIRVRTSNDNYVALHDLCTVKKGLADRRSFSLTGTEESILLSIRARAGTSPVTASKQVRACMRELEANYGTMALFSVVDDQASLIGSSIISLIISSLIGMIVAFIVIFLFLRDLFASGILIASIPLSILSSLSIFSIVGVGINVMSIGGLAVGIGMLVDSPAVILEGINASSSPRDKRVIGDTTCRLSRSILGTTLTGLIVFCPLFFLPGLIGAMFREFAWALTLSYGFSFLVSITIIPALSLCSPASKPFRYSPWNGYAKTLRVALRKPFVPLFICFALTLLAIPTALTLRTNWIEIPESDEYRVSILYPFGFRHDRLLPIAQETIKSVQDNDGIVIRFSHSGGDLNDPFYLSEKEDDGVRITYGVSVLDKSIKSSAQVETLFENATLACIPLRIDVAPDSLSFSDIWDIPIGTSRIYEISGDSHELARKRADAIRNDNPLASLNIKPETRGYYLEATPESSADVSAGFIPSDLAGHLSDSIHGTYAGAIDTDRFKLPIRVRYADKDRALLNSVKSLPMPGPSGVSMPISELLDFKRVPRLPSYHRSGRKPVVFITTREHGLRGIDDASQLGSRQWKQTAIGSLTLITLSAILLYAVLGIQFDSFIVPFLILSIIPIGLSGVILSLAITSNAIGLNASLATLVVIGSSVNNGIILYEIYSNLFNGNPCTVSVYKTICLGAVQRVRSMAIAFFTTALALIPTAMGSFGDNAQSVMAISVIGGLTTSNLASVILFPLLFSMYFTHRKEKDYDAKRG